MLNVQSTMCVSITGSSVMNSTRSLLTLANTIISLKSNVQYGFTDRLSTRVKSPPNWYQYKYKCQHLHLHNTKNAMGVLTENPLPARYVQDKRLALCEHHASLQILQRQQWSPFAQRFHQSLTHCDVPVGGLQRLNDGAKISKLFAVCAAVRRDH